MVEEPKTLKNAKSDGWNYRKQRTTQNLTVEDHLKLKNGKSDGWSFVKPWSTQNLTVEVA